MMKKLELDPHSVTQVDVGYDLSPFLAGELDIWPGFVSNEVLAFRDQGHEVNVILPEDYGVHLYGFTLFTTNQLIEEDPDLVLRFLRATLSGWRWAIENAEEVGTLALKYDSTLDAAHQIAQMKATIPLVHTGEEHIGWMRADVWEGMRGILLEQGLLDKPVNVADVYTMEFLEKIYSQER